MVETISREYRTLDKSEWVRGEWDTEPDKMQWTDASTGYPCLVVRQPFSGHLCGYVGVTEGHPAFKVDSGDVCVSVHGGLTYSSHCDEGGDESKSICHIPNPGEKDHAWWLGFDCAHGGDYSFFTKADSQYIGRGGYRNMEYVRGECVSLASQLKAIARTGRLPQ